MANVEAILIIDIYSDLKDLQPSKCGKKFNDAGEVMLNVWNKGKDLRSRCVKTYIKEAQLNWGARYDHREYLIDGALNDKSWTDKMLNKDFFLSEDVVIYKKDDS